MIAAASAGVDWADDTQPEHAPGPRAATAPVTSGVHAAVRRAAWFAFVALGSLVLVLGGALWLVT